MNDTGFTVPAEKADRQAGLYGFDEAGHLEKRLTCPGGSTLPERPKDMAYVSGGQGLWSTLDDYLAFARIFPGGGEVDGIRLLRPETLKLMVSNRLTESQRAKSQLFLADHGFGLGVAVVLEPGKATARPCGGGVGAVGWPGGFGGWWRADPNNGIVLIFLAHNLVELEQYARGIGLGVFRAIELFQSLAHRLPAE
jgi:CubicO group peptidase (beta-lactamase class C family)